MKTKSKSLAVALSACALALAAPTAALADEVVILRIENIGEWVVVTRQVCATFMGQTACYTYQTHELRRTQQRDISHCGSPGEIECP